MRNELDNKLGTPVTLQFGFATPAAEATTDGTFAQGTPGFVVPDGYHFVSVLVSVAANDAIAAGTAHFRVTNDGTEVARGRGPEVTLSSSAQQGTGLMQAMSHVPVEAGGVVGVSVTTSADYSAPTVDYDLTLFGYLQAKP